MVMTMVLMMVTMMVAALEVVDGGIHPWWLAGEEYRWRGSKKMLVQLLRSRNWLNGSGGVSGAIGGGLVNGMGGHGRCQWAGCVVLCRRRRR